MMAMYPGPAHGEGLRPFSHHERHVSYPIDRPPFGSASRPPHIDLPKPLEPRSMHMLQPPVGEAVSRRPDLFRAPSQQSDFRLQSHNLPRLQDILTSAPSAPSPSPYNSSWSNTSALPGSQRNASTHQSRSSFHGPAAHTSHETVTYQPQPGRPADLPVLQTSPGIRHDSHSAVLPSPYGVRPESRDFASQNGERGRQTPAGSYTQHGTRSPYAPPGHEDPYYRSPALSMDRPGSLGYPNSAPATSSKYLGVRDIPGEGQFHVYEGGQRIPTAVDGESVNPAWGLTKANKPRKRLAMACLDCREKKIKCEPGALSCLQCEKAKRVCRKAPAHQSQSDSTSVSVWSNGAASPTRKSPGDLSSPNGLESERELSQLSHKRRTAEDRSPSEIPNKKHRPGSPLYNLNSTSAPVTAMGSQISPAVQHPHGKTLCWEEDPFAVEPEATKRLMDYYFQDVNDSTYCMFPRNYFMHWLQTCSQKCQNERLLLYAMLAVGSIFSEDSYASFGKHCAHIATEGLHARQGNYGLPTVQARLLLGLYNFAKGADEAGWDCISAGITAATYLDYTTEHGCAVDEKASNFRLEFGFLPEQLVECRRRTMWSAFLMDRYYGRRSTFINPQDIFLRLPCLEDMYERALRSDAPFFNNGVVDPVKCILTSTSPVAPMAWLCVMGGIWGNIVSFVYRAVHRSPLVYEDDYEKFYDKTQRALQDWSLRLPEQLQFNKVNAELSMRRGYAGPFVLMHLLYHLSFVKMNRFVKHSLIRDSLPRNVRATHRHSHELLQVLSAIRTAKMEMMKTDGHMGSFSFTMSFAGNAILAAIDVVGAGGLDTHLNSTLESISCGLECLRELARYWSSARYQDKACEKRYYQIQNVLKHPFTARSGCWLGREWGVHASLENEFSNDDDCIYGAEDRIFFDALRDEQPTSGGARGA